MTRVNVLNVLLEWVFLQEESVGVPEKMVVSL